VELPESQPRNAFLPRLWAGQKIAHELDAIRLSNRPADAETVSSLVKLAKKYGIVTPYTSFLVTEEGADRRVAEESGRQRFETMAKGAAASGFGGGVAAARGAQADSLALSALSGGVAAAAPAALQASEKKAREDLERDGHAAVETRTVGDKTFYRRGKTWLDADAETDAAKSAKTETVKAGGREYFELLAKAPELARWLALGDDVTVLWRGSVLRIVGAD
jgi:Ca-activated chloride channel family protein